MGQKVSPIGMRVGVNRDYSGSWFDEKNYAKNVLEDLELRGLIAKLLPRKRIAKVLISKDSKDLKIDIFTSLFGEVIGQKGENIEKVKNQLFPIAGNRKLTVNVIDVKKPDIEAPIIAEEMAIRVEKKEPYKRVISDLLKKAMKEGVRGIKIMISGRLDGNDIARTEWFSDGTVPLHTLKADIDYALCEAHTTYGRIGCKVWVYRPKENKSE